MRLLLRALATAAAALVLAATPAFAFPAKSSFGGSVDFSYGSSVDSPGGPATGYKPESKLFYTADNVWWGVFGVAPSRWGHGRTGTADPAGVYLYRLDSSGWTRVLQLPGADPWGKADALLDGSTLYVSIRDNRATNTTTGNLRESDLYQLGYAGGGWTLQSGPTPITTGNPETLTIARSSDGRIWTTYETGGRIKVGRTAPGGTAFTYASLPVTAPNPDDISAITSFTDAGGEKVGVMWSDQVTGRDYFAWRAVADTAPLPSGWTIETAWGGGVGCAAGLGCADDHINMKVVGDQVYAVIKTSLNDASPADPAAPLIVLLRRDGDGGWSSFPVSPVSQNASRPIVVLSPATDRIYVFAELNFEGVVAWESPFWSPAFSGAYTSWTRQGVDPIGNPTSTKQVVDGASDLVVETSLLPNQQYWHNRFMIP